MSSLQAPKPRVHRFVQAPVRPLDQDGVAVGIIGTIGWIIASFVLWLNLDMLHASAHGWWLWTGVAGTSLGIIGSTYCYWRRGRRLTRQREDSPVAD